MNALSKNSKTAQAQKMTLLSKQETRPQGYQKVLMLNRTEHETLPLINISIHVVRINDNISGFNHQSQPYLKLIMVGILIAFMRRINFMFS